MMLSVSSIPKIPAPPLPDKFWHTMEYALFAFFLWRAIIAERPNYISLKVALPVLMCGAAFGLFDEFYQSFVPGRESSIRDWYADIAGIFTMLILLRILVPWDHE
jgi:VanZ family protein